MQIDYIARKVTLTNQVRQFTEKKISKIEKYFNDILDIRVEVGQERHRYVADISVKGKDFDIKANSQNKELTTAIQEAVDKLEMQARRAKARLKDRKRQGGDVKAAADWTVDVIEPESVRAGGSPRIVETSTIPIKPMTIEEAMMQLEGTSDAFFVFRDASSDKVNVLYRRGDGNLGLITPEP